MSYRAAPFIERKKPTGRPTLGFDQIPTALLPALSELRIALTGVEAMAIFDTTPEHLQVSLVDYMARRTCYPPIVLRTWIELIGVPRLSAGLGHGVAANLIARFLR
jgi:hypothetical protein